MHRPNHCPHLPILESCQVFLIALCLLHGLARPVIAATGPDATLLTREGKVELFKSGAPDWTPAQTNDVMKLGERVRTGLKSRATLRLANESLLRVNQLTSVTIQLDITGTENPEKPTLEVQSGSTYFFNRQGDQEVNFKTSRASGAIRGTEFNLEVGEDGRTVVTMIDGRVDLKNEFGALSLTSGEQGIVEKGAAPRKTAALDTLNIIQWTLYYPAVLDPDELNLPDEARSTLAKSLEAYRSGELLAAIAAYSDTRKPGSDAEKAYAAALQLASGQVPAALALLQDVASPQANALRELIAAVKNQPYTSSTPASTASELLAHSYHLQSRFKLEAALDAAKAAAAKAPKSGYALARVAELEFSFARTRAALDALNRSLDLAPRNAQAITLQGFLLAASQKPNEAQARFATAIAIDPALGNAWLGHGLTQIRLGKARDGLRDLEVAATLEPNRSLLRSYLGKAFSLNKDLPRARHELDLARQFDPNDPTPWLYSALLNQQQNRINEGISDLEKSKALNDNRALFRSRMLLDQDQAVRGANLAKLYQDAGMTDVAVREASRAVNADYTNPSAHLFLANSYFNLLDPKQFNLRYQSAWFGELLLANLLSPASSGALSQNIAQHEYTALFEKSHLNLQSQTEYFSSGAWTSYNSQSGILDDFSYALDVNYYADPGQRQNNDIEKTDVYGKFKYQLTQQDLLYIQFIYSTATQGDLAQNFGVSSGSSTARVKETQEPNLFLGHRHTWQPGSDTLFLFSWLDDRLTQNDPASQTLFWDQLRHLQVSRNYALNAYSHLRGASFELQQLQQLATHSISVGTRYQRGWTDSQDGINTTPLPLLQRTSLDLERFSIYTYDQWQVLPRLTLIGGVSYDHLAYPINVDTAPYSPVDQSTDKVSPKAGFTLTLPANVHIRGAYTRSLGGAFFDGSVRLEPVQIAGFNQAYRSLAPESATGIVPGTSFETADLGIDTTFKTGTYVGVDVERLASSGPRTIGSLLSSNRVFPPSTPTPFDTAQQLGFEEESLVATLNQRVGSEWSIGLRQRITDARMDSQMVTVPTTVPSAITARVLQKSTLFQTTGFIDYNRKDGWFAHYEAIWNNQSNRGYSPDEPGDDFWIHNVFVGYRFPRRVAEIRLGLLNLFDQNYQLNPLTLYSELPRERTFTAMFRFNF